jgi:CheY-like chemotaxis protein
VTIIILSAYDYSEIEAEAREAGVDEFIAKPLFRSRLTATLKNIIEGKPNKEAKNYLSNIETAENGKEAVEKFANAPSGFYDLIFMDIHMPVMNGYEATAAIRSHRKYREKQIPIIAMTANAFAEDVVKAKNAGMKEHIAKPLEMNRLCEIMQRYL